MPDGFTQIEVAKGFDSPSGIAIAPDGRVFVGEQEGAVRVIEKDSLLPMPVLSLKADAYGQRGLMSIALDPDFPMRPYLYVYYTASSPASHNRLSRFPLSGSRADSSKEEILFDLPEVGSAAWHMGGGIAFGADGKLYCGTGDQQKPAESQDLSSPMGKILRINRDGSIPADNPFYASSAGLARAIWAYGLRNPYTLAAKPGGGILANDVGESSFEEIDDLSPGGNYGWPTREGRASDPKYLDPVHAYSHNNGCSIIGGDFNNPTRPQFPAEYGGKYFFADFCNGSIQTLDPATSKAGAFMDKGSYPTGLRISPDGSLYYLSRGYNTGSNAGEIKRGLGKVFKIQYGESGNAIREPGKGSGRHGGGPRFTLSGPSLSSPAFRIRIDIPSSGAVRVEIRDTRSRLKAVLVDRPRYQGPLDLSWSPGRIPSGILFVVLKHGDRAWARIMPHTGD